MGDRNCSKKKIAALTAFLSAITTTSCMGIRTYLKTHRFYRLCFLAETGEQRTNAQINFLTETSKTRIRKRAGIERMSPYFERRKEVTKSLPIFLEALGFFLSDRDHASVLGRSEVFQFHLAFVKAT